MGPPSDNGGYAVRAPARRQPDIKASMGPPSDNGGYGRLSLSASRATPCFNGSTVR